MSEPEDLAKCPCCKRRNVPVEDGKLACHPVQGVRGQHPCGGSGILVRKASAKRKNPIPLVDG